MIQHLRPAVVMLALFTLLTGVLYPLSVTGLAQAFFPDAANGSLVRNGGAVVGSRLIGQSFADERYFQPRPSATSAPDPQDSSKTVDAPYNAGNSSGSNFGPLSKKLVDRVTADVASLKSAGVEGAVPADAVTTSASGLDPHISPRNAELQLTRVAKARGLSEAQLRGVVDSHIEGRLFGVLGEPRVNVLLLNLALDRLK